MNQNAGGAGGNDGVLHDVEEAARRRRARQPLNIEQEKDVAKLIDDTLEK